uniref:Uncharacterized protein n=1 Tax=Arundo donax TaxID=35708 RepID=A0A0A8Z8F6_ARUDO
MPGSTAGAGGRRQQTPAHSTLGGALCFLSSCCHGDVIKLREECRIPSLLSNSFDACKFIRNRGSLM